MSESKSYTVELPVIDVYEDLSESALSSLSEACSEWGFFYIRNHGVSKEFYQKLISIADQLFCLPHETKNKVGFSCYIPRFIASPFYESFKFSGPDFSASAHHLTETLLGKHDAEFSNLLKEYGSKMTDISRRIVKLLLKILGDNFENKFYDSEFSNCDGYLRMNNYSPQDSNENVKIEEVEGLGKHTDISCVTILFQDHVGGLQMRSKEGEWMDIKPCEDALVVNIGDFMHAWSNEKLRSAEHRVVLRQNSVKRFSMVFIWSFEDDKEIYAPSEVVGEGNARLYKPFLTKEYRIFRATPRGARENYEKVGANVTDFAGIVG
ncbi:gibberellin 20-oxidase-like protein [Momordica charantia]|uniref:Gibberellin 20-oxidase-like protein n=1 Tax=Momordica charantia TaxID=3673 RepID=A0A6J1CI97_MOMCH|nr:gibberellin 20-oxidase-like protein [Momordica charantia]